MRAILNELACRARLSAPRDVFAIGKVEAGNFERLRASPGMTILRTAAETAVTDLFDGRPLRVELSESEAGELLILFMESKPLFAAKSRVEALGDRLELIDGAFGDLQNLETLILSHHAPMDVERSVSRHLFRCRPPPPSDWRGAGPLGAEAIGATVARAAFTDPRVHRACLTGLRKMLKRRILMPPGEAHLNVRLSLPFFWCLLAIAIKSSEGGAIRQAAHDAVCGEAELAVRTAGWAGFWEQWCLKLVLSDAVPREAESLVRMVENLPLIRGDDTVVATGQLEACGESEQTSDEEGWGVVMTRPDWKANAPPFAARLVDGSL